MIWDAVLQLFLGAMGGVTVGVCAAPLWMMLQIPMRLTDVLDAKTDMRLCGCALAVGATIGTLHIAGFLPLVFGILVMALGGFFVGMLASALAEAVEVVPALFDRLSITADMRIAAAAMAVGKTAGAVLAGLLGV